VNALCPGFADTAINEPVRHLINAAGIPLMTADSGSPPTDSGEVG
jgi:hypothetical protein